MEGARTIEQVLHLPTRGTIDAHELFRDQRKREDEIFQLRTRIENQIQTKSYEYVCLYCKQPVAVRGRRSVSSDGKHFYFTHLYKSDDCIIKTMNRLTAEEILRIEYNGVKEGKEHHRLKNLIGQMLDLDAEVKSVHIDKVYQDRAVSKQWRKPDVLALFQDKKVAFELQLRTTFLSVIVERTRFYRERGIFLIWVFNDFSVESEAQRFMEKDVFYNNYSNVYVFDEEAQRHSLRSRELVLKCYYRVFFNIGVRLESRWENKLIRLSDLTFKHDTSEVYYHDSDSEKKTTQRDIETTLANAIKKREENERKEHVAFAVDQVVISLREFYKTDREPGWPYRGVMSFVDRPDVVTALDERMKFTGENSYVIRQLFTERKRPNFLQFICENEGVPVRTDMLVDEYYTLFQAIVHDRRPFLKYLALLCRRGYQFTNPDLTTMDQFYEKARDGQTDVERENMQRWAFSKMFLSLKTKEFALAIPDIESLLLAVASLKHGITLGTRFKNLRELTNHVLEYKPYASIYLHALKAYGQYEIQISEDKSGRLKEKIDRAFDEKPWYRSEYDNLLEELFPEVTALGLPTSRYHRDDPRVLLSMK